ncbi:YARHG domain-containing protein [Ciceribacter lividus]|uniref:YARHG domain-containing protein n=1 Tax=Ciceribacter lividus TaxID=1197950 RepID=A0A6I7HMV7_9HYPH|nr:YARHG domain-containing protein [Ciceribacter lividus]RCW24131.1 YARHG domain-containing protein [Ciceribacter lividus]
MTRERISATVSMLAIVVPLYAVTSAQAFAQDYGRMSCDELWYERNAIYAAKGYCFKTDRVRSVFGRGCFPPFGKLTRSETRRVNLIEQWERYYGCR